MRLAATVQYSGHNFYGFQRQKEFRTVQGELERALSTYLRVEVLLYPAGRTDTGVSAEGQVIHFEINGTPELDELLYAVNAILPADVSISFIKEVEQDFHARFSCIGRIYSYTILNSPRRQALHQSNSVWIRRPIDEQKLEKLLIECASGELDFRAFTKASLVKRGEPTFRRLEKFKVLRHGDLLFIVIKGSGFLHNMVRILVGSAVESLWEKSPEDNFRMMMEKGDRRLAGKTLPANALTFLNAKYKDYKTPSRFLPTYSLLGMEESEW